MTSALALAFFVLLSQVSTVKAFSDEKMVLVPAGQYVPFYPEKDKDSKSEPEVQRPVQIKSFKMDIFPITNADYLEFVRRNPTWQKSKIKSIFADSHYLQNWKGDLQYPRKIKAQSAVTFVSWYSAKAYCESVGKTLPTVDQWEYAVFDNGHLEKKTKERALKWYSEPNMKTMPSVGSTFKNGFGVYDLQGLIWEWTYDFNTPLGGDPNVFCGSSAVGTTSSSDYVNYMRFAFRASLKASYTTANLGFRCVKEVVL